VTTDNPVRGPLNALVFRVTDGYADLVFGRRKRALFADLPRRVVEIGPGTGANLRYYRPGTTVVAVEPNPHMHAPLAATARRRGVDLEVRARGAESTGLADAGADAVVCTLVLCTVPDPAAAIAEIRRVLRPGGRLIFLEHVHATGFYGLVQRVVARPWKWFFEGCDVRRDTERALTAGGFADVAVERYRAPTVFLPINPQIAGTATR
jgi:SAM-dependent methyltransferase